MSYNKDYLIYLIEKVYNETGTLIYQKTDEEQDENKTTPEQEMIGRKIADDAGLEYMGWWKDLNAFWFNDPVTHSTIIAKDSGEAIHKKEKLDIAVKAAKQAIANKEA